MVSQSSHPFHSRETHITERPALLLRIEPTAERSSSTDEMSRYGFASAAKRDVGLQLLCRKQICTHAHESSCSHDRYDPLFTMSDNKPRTIIDRDATRQFSWTRHSDEQDPAGGARRDRTDDLLLAKQALSQLSYGPGRTRLKRRAEERVVGLGRFELPTSRLSSARSNQLSYKPSTGQSGTNCLTQSARRDRHGLVHEERET